MTAVADWVREPAGSEVPDTRNRQRPPVDLDARGIVPIDWSELWALDPPGEERSIPQICPRGRESAIFGSAGVGKSLLAADISAAKSTGRSVLGQPATDPVSVVYIDAEMTPGDLQERLSDLGYGPEDDLSNLHYYQLQDLPGLDTLEGGDVVMAIVERDAAETLVLDTMTALIAGEESSSDTYRQFHRNTAMRLKASGISLLRIDHEGKDPSRGQRGSSAKGDEADVIWRLTVNDDQLILKNTKRRVPYVAETIAITRKTEPHLRHVLASEGLPTGTLDTANLLDSLGVAIDTTAAIAIRALKDAGHGRRKVVILAALKLRRERARTVPGTMFGGSDQKRSEPTSEPTSSENEKSQVSGRVNGSRNHREPTEPAPQPIGSRFPPSKRGTGDQGHLGTDQDEVGR